MPLETRPFGPFTKGVIDSGNPSVDLSGALRALRNGVYSGAMKLSVRPGTVGALTLYDDAGTPAQVSSVVAVVPFADGALAVAWSTATQKCYLYKLTAALDGWYNAAGALQATLTPQPQGVLWTAMTVAPDVSIAEGLGVAYIAHCAASDATGLFWATRTYDNTSRAIADYSVDLDGTGAKPVYFCAVASFELALWGAGFGTGALAATGYRPELARFSPPNFAAMKAADSITIGNRVRSERERIVGFGVAKDCLFIGAPYLLTRVTGFGRSSWFKKPLDDSHGFVGPKCFVADGATLYYWSSRGPMRVNGLGDPEPLWDAINALVQTVVNPQTIVASRDETRNLVIFTVDTGAGVRTWCGFDVTKEIWVGPDNDWGLAICNAGAVDQVVRSTATPPSGSYPTGDPSAPVTSSIGSTSAIASWTAGDVTSPTNVYIKRTTDSVLTLITTLPAGQSSYTFTGLAASQPYQWAVEHAKGGHVSAMLGPSVGTGFTTATGTLLPPTSVAASGGPAYLDVFWTNSGESGVSSEVHVAGPAGSAPADGAYTLRSTAVPGASSARISSLTPAGTYWAKVRHTKSLYSPSAFAGPDSDSVSVGGGGL
jgi:hypothetical protein